MTFKQINKLKKNGYIILEILLVKNPQKIIKKS